MAEAMGLPPRVREVIQQHHGTTLMKYFYNRASGGSKNADSGGSVPLSRSEAAVKGSGDSDAGGQCGKPASRTLDKPTPARIVGICRPHGRG